MPWRKPGRGRGLLPVFVPLVLLLPGGCADLSGSGSGAVSATSPSRDPAPSHDAQPRTIYRDSYIENIGGKSRVVVDQRYAPRPEKK